MKVGILPIFIFEGKPPAEKQEVLFERKKRKSKSLQTITDLEEEIEKNKSKDIPTADLETALEKARNSLIIVTWQHIDEVKHILKLLGIPIIEPDKLEAEQVASFMQNYGMVDFVISDDTDCLAFSANYVVRSQPKGKMQLVDKAAMLEKLEMSQETFVELCILCGSDYCPTIPKCGYVTSFRMMKKHRSFDTLMRSTDCPKNIPENFIERFKSAKDIFMNTAHFDTQRDTFETIVSGGMDAFNKLTVQEYLLGRQWTTPAITRFVTNYQKVYNSILTVGG